MDEEIREALHEAYAGEAKAVLRLDLFAQQAEKEGFPQIAKLFRVIAFSEKIHGERALRVLREVGDTQQNLSESFESEQKVAQVAYSGFIKKAWEQGEKEAALHFTQSRDVEETHAQLYKNALDTMMEEKEANYHVCTVCGYVSENLLPEECPICQAKKEKFVKFE
jgi:rubrerythrin